MENNLHINNKMINILKGKKVICLVDGEHYPPVTKQTLEKLLSLNIKINALFFLGGTEKVKNATTELKNEKVGYRIYQSKKDGISYEMMDEMMHEIDFDIVIDLSDEPVVDYNSRFKIGSYVLKHGKDYLSADYYFQAPDERRILTKPNLSIIGTGKRIGKTAIGVTVARVLKKYNYDPVVICMGRGGPPEPDFVNTVKMEMNEETLIKVAEKGGHAASDYWEDAILGDVPTIGCRRCGGGFAGNPFFSNVIDGVKMAEELPHKFVIMEGSGSTLPPIKADKKIVLAGAHQDISKILGFFGQYRIMISDLAILTMCEKPLASRKKIQKIYDGIKEIKPNIKVILTKFRPLPLGDINNKKVFVATTAQGVIRKKIIKFLEKRYDIKITGYTNHLSNREKLKKDLDQGLKNSDILLTEIKAASIDVAALTAKKNNVDVVFMHNQPVIVGGDVVDLEKELSSFAEKIVEEYK